ncbi:MAG: TonB-dependent receptor plug domain-containing protein [Bryobacterales bacterium]|nr:TonB-dependent receptor plug domain-containing protein [Bryobacterales bacterium]
MWRNPPIGRLRSTAIAAILACLSQVAWSPAAFAQTETYSVLGQAYLSGSDGEHFGVAGAAVELHSLSEVEPEPSSPDSQGPAVAETNELGLFRFDGLAEGCYYLIGTSPGMSGQSDIACVPSEEDPLRIDVELEVDTVVESVNVTASVIAIDPTETTSSGSVGVSTLDNAPKANRSVEDVMPLIPGVLRGRAGEINMNGVRATQSGSQLNSVDVTDPVARTSEMTLPLSVVSSVEVLSSPYDAQYGGFAGAMSTVETRASDPSEFRFDLQNFTPRIRRRAGKLRGIESSTPRLTVNVPLISNRVAWLHATEYQYVRADQEDANLPLLERDVEREMITIFNQFDAFLSERNTVSLTALVYPEKFNYFGLNAFTPQESTADLRKRAFLYTIKDSHQFVSGGVLLSNFSIQELSNEVKPLGDAPSIIGIDRAAGSFFNRQARMTTRRKLSELYHFRPLGRHQLKAGFDWGWESYRGEQIFNPVTWLGVGDRPVMHLRYTDPTMVSSSKTDMSGFLQNKWTVNDRLTLDLGARLDRDSISSRVNPSYRAGFAYAFGGGSRTVLRGGSGLFVDRISLLVPAFEQLPVRIETGLLPDGGIAWERRLRSRFDGPIRNAKSLGWNLQLDREIIDNLFLRTGFQYRRTLSNFLVNPVYAGNDRSDTDALAMSSGGRDYYREFQVSLRYRLSGTGHITASYVRSSSSGDLNDLGSIYGPTPSALILPNQRAPLRFDVPHRMLAWTEFNLPWGLKTIPVWEVRSGFPHSNLDEYRNLVGPRNRAGRFPIFNAVDLQITKKVSIPFRGKDRRFRAGIRLFNLLNNFNPQDVQQNLASPHYGVFYRGVKRKIRAVFEIGY